MALVLEQATLIGNELALSFSDDAEAYIELSLLRRACPCATCQGEPDALGRVVKPLVSYGPRAFELERFQGVGGYALQLFWADGHSSGIYSYPYLLRLAGLSSN